MNVITVEKQGHVFLIGLNEPQKLNSFSLQMLHELAGAYTAFEDDADARCAVLFAHGPHFTSGLRLNEVGPKVASGELLFPKDRVDPLDLFGRRRTKPVVMAVQGWCLTIGIELLLGSDIGVASQDTRFAQMEVRRGIMPFGGATLRFAQRCGWGNAMRWLLSGAEFDASEAHRIGLVQQLVEPGSQLEVALALATDIANQAPLAVQASRRSAQLAMEQGPKAALEALLPDARALFATQDAAEGVRSFVERRAGKFEGR